MTAPSSDLHRFIQHYPLLYRKLCFWAAKRGAKAAATEVQQYLSDLVLIPDDADATPALARWSAILSMQEKQALLNFTPLLIGTTPFATHWYSVQKGEYSVSEEPVVQELYVAGKEQGIVTQNRYDCLVLNCNEMLMVDVDIGSPDGSAINDCSSNSQIALSLDQAIAAVDRLTRLDVTLGFRMYRTRNGLRHLCTTQRFDPLGERSQQVMAELYVDPLYARLCRFQGTFRARLTPKPWRVGTDYWEDWVKDAETGTRLSASTSHAVCHLLGIAGNPEILPQFEPLIRIHDACCRVNRLDLELA